MPASMKLIKLDHAGTFYNEPEPVKKEKVKSIVTTLIIPEKIRELSLRNNDLCDETITPVIHALTFNTSLISLDLNENPLGDSSGKALIIALAVNTTLRSLVFDATHMSEDIKINILYSLEHYNRSITNIEIRDCALAKKRDYNVEAELICSRNNSNSYRLTRSLVDLLLAEFEYGRHAELSDEEADITYIDETQIDDLYDRSFDRSDNDSGSELDCSEFHEKELPWLYKEFR